MRKKVAGNGSIERNPVTHVLIQPARRGRVIRPINEERLANHVAGRHKAPITAVAGIVAIIAHNKQLAFGHNGRPPALCRTVHWRVVHSVGFVHRLRIYVKHAIADLQAIASHRCHALEKSLRWVLGITKDDDVSAMSAPERGQPPMDQWYFRPIEQLVHEKMT